MHSLNILKVGNERLNFCRAAGSVQRNQILLRRQFTMAAKKKAAKKKKKK
jgi:hypothetical protein